MDAEDDHDCDVEELEANHFSRQQKDWARSFADPITFCRHYLRFRKLFFTVAEPLASTVELTLDAFLQDRFKSHLLDPETRIRVLDAIGNAVLQIRSGKDDEDE